MTTVALPTVVAPALGAEADLVRRAARADEDAFCELYRRHAQTAWRLAHAVTLTRQEAAGAAAEGFVRVLRAVRRHQVSAADPFRPLVLAGVYRSSTDRLRRYDQPAAVPAPDSGAGSIEAVFVEAAFRSLPERWRAALWLTEVEGLTADQVAPVLGVSSAVATQLAGRGGRALADRHRQAGQEPPEFVGAALRPLAATMPAGLAAIATEAWRASVASDPTGRFVPSLGWVGERAGRPLAVVVGGILALGLVGVGVLGQRAPLDVTVPAAAEGQPAPSSLPGVPPASNSAGSSSTDTGNFLVGAGGTASFLPTGAVTSSGAATSTGSGTPPTAAATSPNPTLPGAGGSTAAPGAGRTGSPAAPVPTTAKPSPGKGTTGGTSGTTPSTTTPNQLSISTTNGLAVTVPNPLNPPSAAPLATATLLSPTCTLSVNLLGIQVGQCPTPTATPTAAGGATTTASTTTPTTATQPLLGLVLPPL